MINSMKKINKKTIDEITYRDNVCGNYQIWKNF